MPSENLSGPTEDVNHPVPRLDTLDTVLTTEKGAFVGIVIATPLRNDEVSKERLRVKFEMTVGYFLTPEYKERYGSPSPEFSRIMIRVHAGSDPAMIDLVEHFTSQIPAFGIAPDLKWTHAS